MLKEIGFSLSLAEIERVSPALARYAREVVLGSLWPRVELAPRDRSIATLAMLIARNQVGELAHQVEAALDHGVSAAEVSEIITHLAFYCGWPAAMAAIVATQGVFAARGVTAEALPAASPELLSLDKAAEQQRATLVESNVGPISPGLVEFTAAPLFLDLWQRPALAPRDRSMVTVSALIAAGQSAQIGYHLNRALDNGLSAAEAGELVAQAAFYAGWPNAFSAVAVVGEVLRTRMR